MVTFSWQLTLAPACSFPGTPQWPVSTEEALSSYCRVVAEFFLDVTILLACRTDSASVRNTAMVLFFCESTTREIVIINASAF